MLTRAVAVVTIAAALSASSSSSSSNSASSSSSSPITAAYATPMSKDQRKYPRAYKYIHRGTDNSKDGKKHPVDGNGKHIENHNKKNPNNHNNNNNKDPNVATITTVTPNEAFEGLLSRTFGNPRVLFKNKAMSAKDVMANITFVPTKWVTSSSSASASTSMNTVENEHGHSLLQRVWKGPNHKFNQPMQRGGRRGNTAPIDPNAAPTTSAPAPAPVETTKIQYQCDTPHTLTIYAETASDAGYALHHYLRHSLASGVEWGIKGTGYNIVIPEDGLVATCGSSSASTSTRNNNNNNNRNQQQRLVDGSDYDTRNGIHPPPNRRGGGGGGGGDNEDKSGDADANKAVVTEDGATNSVYINSIGKYRYYYNVCTFGYTSAFWTWDDRWEQEIDWMALHGNNLVLMSLPTEYMWILTYTLPTFGLNATDATAYFTGPAFLPWNRMGNIHSYAGPASVGFFKQQFEMALRIVQRMRDLGINPVLPAFDGHVADAFVQKYKSQYPNDFARGADWGGLGVDSSNWILLPSSALFKELGVAYLQSIVKHFGRNTYYAADTWNEMVPPDSSTSYLKSCATAVVGAIRAVDPNGIWLMQGWTFYNDRYWWGIGDRVQDYLSGAPLGQLIVLDLSSDNNPVYPWTSGYFGHWFIWNMLHNYGGKRGIWGAMGVVASTPSETFLGGAYPSMVGVGTTPEGSETNPVLYALLFDSAWGVVKTQDGLKNEWLPMFWKARFGTAVTQYDATMAAQFTLPMLDYRGAYTFIPPCCSHFVAYTQRPWLTTQGFSQNPLGVNTNYDPDSVTKALLNLLKPLGKMGKEGWRALAAAKDPGLVTYRYELVDYLRQTIGCILTDVQFNLAAYLQGKFPYNYRYSYRGGPTTTTTASPMKAAVSNETIDNTMAALNKGFAELMGDVEKVVGTDDNHLFGRWLQEAKDTSPTKEEESFFLFNAIRQVTLWGPKDAPGIHDYAAKQWDGLISAFYIPRWKLFFDFIGDTIKDNGGQFSIPAEDAWDVESIELIESPAAETLQNESFAVDPTTSLEGTYDVIVAMADKFVPNWNGDASWADAYEIHTNVKIVGAAPIFRSWTGMATSQHVMCTLLPDCTAFVPSDSPYGGQLYAFTTPNVTAGGSSTVYIKKAAKK